VFERTVVLVFIMFASTYMYVWSSYLGPSSLHYILHYLHTIRIFAAVRCP